MKVGLVLICVFIAVLSNAQPAVDTDFKVEIASPFFAENSRPKVMIDEAHNNIHTKDGGLYAFTKLMEDDGAEVYANSEKFTEALLSQYDVVFIVNALHDSNVNNWRNPCPSAFSDSEIDALVGFVKSGGSLLLVADHMPLGGSVQKLADEFGIEWSNSFAMQNGNHWPPSTFEENNNTLLRSPVTDSTSYGRHVSTIGTFTGSAFKIPNEGIPFLKFDDSHRLLMPDVAWKFDKKTKNQSAEGWYQGACLAFEDGKLVLLGEAAMITAQLRGKTKIGMNSPDAPENGQLAINIFRYLAHD